MSGVLETHDCRLYDDASMYGEVLVIASPVAYDPGAVQKLECGLSAKE